ncbi:MAG: YggS family pyridoxal phosphate-dependent enzyme [Cryobacterium sp.]|nr:YggS family pyridoxal phosphate-dependent enzyme [Cryobacterium sp.]
MRGPAAAASGAGASFPGLAERLSLVESEIQEAAREAGRHAEDITTIVVTKFQPPGMVRALAQLGITNMGESRHQEALGKVAQLSDLGITWHFVGQVQGKKARQIASYARVIHSVDRVSVLDAIGSTERSTSVFLQLNLTDDPARGGVQFEDLPALAEYALSTPGIDVRGVMAVAPLGGDARGAFAQVAQASKRLQSVAPEATEISAGMSGDFREAILEGATHLRIGTAITGNRPSAG